MTRIVHKWMENGLFILGDIGAGRDCTEMICTVLGMVNYN